MSACAVPDSPANTKTADLAARWAQLPAALTVNRLEQDPDLEQSVIQLAYDTETILASTCGAPTGDDASLLRIAQHPSTVEQE